MSLLNFFNKVNSGTKRKHEESNDSIVTPKKAKVNTVSEKNQKYDSTKRERKFQQHWQDTYTWLVYDKVENKMYCKVCRDYPKLATANPSQPPVFVTGTDKFCIETIRSHDTSGTHCSCQSQYRCDKETTSTVTPPTPVVPKETAIGKAILNIGEKEMEKMKMLFNTAYTLAVYNKPFSDMEMMCELMCKNGLNLGENYQNKARAREFVSAISKTLQNDITEEILSSSFISILADGSTDVSIVEQEVVYVRYIVDNTVKTKFISIEDLASSDAKGVKSGLYKALNNVGLNFQNISDVNSNTPTLVCANFDGASVMQGRKNGTMGLILQDAPWVLPMHCVTHKLELGALDSVKSNSYLRQFEDVLKGLYMFYHYSPKRRREVKAVAEILESDLMHISGIKQVRWMASKTRALAALVKNYTPIVAHMEDVAARKSGDEAARAKGYLKHLTSRKFTMMLHAMLDILSVLADLSLVFQQQDLFIFDVYPQVESHLLRLEELKHDNGPHLKKYLTDFQTEDGTFCGVELKGPEQSTDFITDLVDDMISYIDKRFENFNTAVR